MEQEVLTTGDDLKKPEADHLQESILITRRAEFHGLCPWVNGDSPIGRQA
jgi:hypothetical protein